MGSEPREGARGHPPAAPCDGSAGEVLASRRDRLYARLEDGWEKIDRVQAAGGDAEELIDFWIALLRAYERTCDAIAAET